MASSTTNRWTRGANNAAEFLFFLLTRLFFSRQIQMRLFNKPDCEIPRLKSNHEDHDAF